MADIPFLDLGRIQREHSAALEVAFHRVLESGWYILGREVEAFEREFAEYCQAASCVGVANGLDALVLSLRALDVGAGDEVIVPANTYIATWLAVTHVGATLVPVEPDPDTANIDVARIEAAITPQTKVILPVHLYGRSANMAAITALARRHGLHVVEDAAQAHGARHGGRRIGAHGDLVAWSFYPGKNLGALGDGGAVTTDDMVLADRIRKLRNYGSRVKYHNEVIGTNSRLDELQAAFLRARLPHLDTENAKRARIAQHYIAGLTDLTSRGLVVPAAPPADEHVWHVFVIRHPQRDQLAAALAAQGIGTLIHYPIAPHRQQAYAGLGWGAGSFPLSEALHREVLSLPMGPTMSLEDADRVIRAVRASA